MLKFARALAEWILPARSFITLQSVRSRNYQKRLLQRTGHIDATLAFVERHGLEVRYGPFLGMRYPMESITSRNGIPLLLGTYELELHPVIEGRRAEVYDLVIDIGCGEGYYAVGLARLLQIPVHAFDTEFRERKYCRRMAVANHVGALVRIHSWCSPTCLGKLARGKRSLVICDCEGFEADLFDRKAVEDLKSSDLLIEIHEVSGLDVKRTLCDRLAKTHEIRQIPFTGAGPDRPELICLGPEGQRFVREMRNTNQEWLWASALVKDRI